MEPATYPSISARPPLASPASTMEMKSVGNALGNFLTEDEKELPWEMSSRTSRTMIRNTGSSVWSWRASRHWTRGRPAVRSDESCWVNIVSSPRLTLYLLAFFSSDFCFARACAARTSEVAFLALSFWPAEPEAVEAEEKIVMTRLKQSECRPATPFAGRVPPGMPRMDQRAVQAPARRACGLHKRTASQQNPPLRCRRRFQWSCPPGGGGPSGPGILTRI